MGYRVGRNAPCGFPRSRRSRGSPRTCRSHTRRNSSAANPARRRKTPRPPPSTLPQIFQLQPSLYSIMYAVRHISQYVQNRSDLFCHFSDAPRPWGMQPNTSFRLRMCISPLMFRSDIIPFFSCTNPLHRQTFLHPNCQNRPDIFSHPSPCTSFIAICVSQSKTTTRNKQPRILPPPAAEHVYTPRCRK